MLNLYDRTIESRKPDPAAGGLPISNEPEPHNLAHTTAAQLLFLVEGSEVIDSRPLMSTFDRMTRGR